MPSPLEILLDPLSLVILAMYAILILWEALFPARPLPRIKYWRVKGIITYLVFFYLSTYVPMLYAHWLPSAQLVNLTNINVALAALTGVLLYQFSFYFYHRNVHRSNFLWRLFHQMHHSAERLDTFGAFYYSPYEMVSFTLLGTLCFSFIIGLPAQSVTIVLLTLNFFSIFQHANIKTPQWIGYIIQRPESHAIHHAKGIHAFNYSDLPLFDILFGTFRNPKEYVPETGFYNGASSKIKDMLMIKDINKQISK
jgi:sterol desaturase/sphingolipid hydroxylase (fatty acid hydroxylase superfamily)